MRLLTYDESDRLRVSRDLADDAIEPYAILSHTWGKDEEEVTFGEVELVTSKDAKAGLEKIQLCGKQARQDGWQHFWVDTCCIDKANHTELSKAITSMYRWYQNAQVCYVYLADVLSRPGEHNEDFTRRGWESTFRTSRWFRRGWTLQELLAPRQVVFYSKEWNCLGTKNELKGLLCDITGIPTTALEGRPLSQFPVIERMRWAQGRQTKEKEDQAYCLLGIFGIYMYLNYGEGDHAFRRLQREIDAQSSGDGAANIPNHQLYPQEDVRSLGLCLTSAPLISADEFVGRTVEIDAIHNILQPDDVRLEQRRVVLGGVGGIGKTQLAIAYARQYAQSYTSVLWLNATSELTLYASLRSVARAWSATSQIEQLANEQILAHVHEWLSNTRSKRWLLIFDNHDDPDIFDLDQFCPNVGHGSVIVTTRLPDQLTGPQIRLQPIDQIEDSLRILATRSRRKNVQSDPGARRLAKRVAGLPLALVTAGTYLRRNTLSFQQYLDAYENHWQINQRHLPQIRDYRDRTLYTTWNLSYSRLEEDYHEAAQLLKLLAYFDNQDLWYELFQAGLSGHSLSGHPLSGLHAVLNNEIDFASVMGILVDYCLVEVQHATKSYSLHNCVHDWTLGSLNQEIDARLYWYAFNCVAASVDGSDWQVLGNVQYTRVSHHGVRLTHHRFEPCDELGLSEHLDKAVLIAWMLGQQLHLSAAEQMCKRALATYERVLGPDHALTLTTINNLGLLYADQGNFMEAEQVYQQALIRKEKTLGPNHTSTLDTMNNLGLLYVNQGKFIEAEQMYQQALAGYEEIFGPNHSSTFDTLNNLGGLYLNQAKFVEAEQMYIRALAGYEQVHGPDYILTLNTVDNIGGLYAYQWKLEEAEKMFTRALTGREGALGPDHTLTLTTIHNLGTLYWNQDKVAEAEQMYIRALAGREKALGPSHPSTLGTVSNLGLLYAEQGKLDEAEQMLVRVVVGRTRALGADHGKTLEAEKDLKDIRQKLATRAEERKVSQVTGERVKLEIDDGVSHLAERLHIS